MNVCPNIFASGDQTASPIWTGEAPFQEPDRWKEDGANREAIVTTHHVRRQADEAIAGWWCTRRNMLISFQTSAASNVQNTPGRPLLQGLLDTAAWADTRICLSEVTERRSSKGHFVCRS